MKSKNLIIKVRIINWKIKLSKNFCNKMDKKSKIIKHHFMNKIVIKLPFKKNKKRA